MKIKNTVEIDVCLIGGGIMSATLGALINEIDPTVKIHLFEKLSDCGNESSDALNNAGTGHAGYCELNYTPQDKKGNINIEKAIQINEMFETSLQFWGYLAKKDKHFDPKKFISKSSHASFVWNKNDKQFLKERFNLLKKQPLFKGLKYYEKPDDIKKLFPLLMEKRSLNQPIALTNYTDGTDVNFGELTRLLIAHLQKQKNFTLHTNAEVINIHKNKETFSFLHKETEYNSKFLFIGAGGNAIRILQKMKIREARGYAGFPVSGKWLITENKKIIKMHKGKVYSQAETNAPPMSVPHLDIRQINGKEYLLFGPFAGFTTKFLKNGSVLDLFMSIKLNNIKEITSVFFKNIKLLKYLIFQALSSNEQRMKQLRKFFPNAKNSDWKLMTAGQRVQIIKPYNKVSGTLEFGTRIIYNHKKNLAALLGASPGASVSVSSMLEIIQTSFKTEQWEEKIKKIIPSFGLELNKKPKLLKQIRESYKKDLKIT